MNTHRIIDIVSVIGWSILAIIGWGIVFYNLMVPFSVMLLYILFGMIDGAYYLWPRKLQSALI